MINQKFASNKPVEWATGKMKLIKRVFGGLKIKLDQRATFGKTGGHMEGRWIEQKFCIWFRSVKLGPGRPRPARYYTIPAGVLSIGKIHKISINFIDGMHKKNLAHSSQISQVLRMVISTFFGFFLQKKRSFLTNSPTSSSCHFSRVLSSYLKVLYFESFTEKSYSNAPSFGIVKLGLFLQFLVCSFLLRSRSLVVPTFKI